MKNDYYYYTHTTHTHKLHGDDNIMFVCTVGGFPSPEGLILKTHHWVLSESLCTFCRAGITSSSAFKPDNNNNNNNNNKTLVNKHTPHSMLSPHTAPLIDLPPFFSPHSAPLPPPLHSLLLQTFIVPLPPSTHLHWTWSHQTCQ